MYPFPHFALPPSAPEVGGEAVAVDAREAMDALEIDERVCEIEAVDAVVNGLEDKLDKALDVKGMETLDIVLETQGGRDSLGEVMLDSDSMLEMLPTKDETSETLVIGMGIGT